MCRLSYTGLKEPLASEIVGHLLIRGIWQHDGFIEARRVGVINFMGLQAKP